MAHNTWAFSVLVWPILKWVVSIDCVFQFIRMLYFWNTAGHYAGAVFLLHFFVLTFLTYFVTIYKPKGI
ncbi:MAG: KleE stable inheritance protein [Methylococcales bacterium]|nr:KleE stable inheritance protein [Methylococcales bacterium]